MKTSDFTQVEHLIKLIETKNREIAELDKCNLINATVNNYQAGQIRLTVNTIDAVGSKVREAWKQVLEQRKASYIQQLEGYDVRYDGD